MEISDADLSEIERKAVAGNSEMHHWCARLVSECRRLRHELADPNYQYSGRIHRQAILCRNAEIDRLRDEIRALKAAASPPPAG